MNYKTTASQPAPAKSQVFFLELRCQRYIKSRLRAPPQHQVLTWAKRMGVTRQEALHLSDRLPYRHALGEG